MTPAHLARINYAGDLGYELWVAPEYQRELFDRIVAAGEPHGLRLFGMRALMSLRLEKSYGTWFREYRPIYTPVEGGITRYLRLDHEFIGRAAHEAETAAGGPSRRLVAMVVEPDPDAPADVIGDEPIWHDGAVVGWVTSGGYGHTSAVDRAGVRAGGARHTGRPGRRRVRDRDHRPASPGPPPARAAVRSAGSPDAPVTEGDARPAAGSSSTGGRSSSRRATRVAVAIVRGRRGSGPRRHALPRRRLRQLPRPGRRRSPTCGRARRRRGPASSSGGIRAGGKPPLPVVDRRDVTRTPAGRTSRFAGRRRSVVVIGRSSGRRPPAGAARPRRGLSGIEVVGIYPGPAVVARERGACSTSGPTR